MTAATREVDVLARSSGARVIPIPPPLYYAAGFGAGMLMRFVTPAAIGGRPATTTLGFVILAVGLGIAATGVVTATRRATTIVPHHPVSTLLTSGVYRVSRNPMYAGLALAYAGGTLVAGTWWPLVALPVVLVVIRVVVIGPEERYLAGRFGSSYADYCRRTRRWL